MPIVNTNIIKEWFSNLKKPPQEQFWAWLDSFRHKWEKVPLDDVEGLTGILQKKADLVDGVVPEEQLPFSVVTSEVITLGSLELIDTKTYLRLHSSGANKVRVKGKLITRTFQNQWTITPIVADGVKVLRGYAVKNNDDFLLAEGAELPTYVEPEIPEDALEIFKITMRSSGNVIEQTETGLKYIAEDGWRNILLTEELTVLPYNFDLKSSYWINSRVANPVIGGIHNGVIDRNASPTWDGKEFWLFNNTGGDLLLDPSNVTAIDVYLFSDKLMPLTIKKSNAVLLKLKDNVIEIMQGGGGGASFPVSGNDGDVLVKSGTSALWSSIIKGVEFLGNAWLKLKLISFQGYTIAQKNAIASPVEGMLIYQSESPKGFYKYEGGLWTQIGVNIGNSDLTILSNRLLSQAANYTHDTAGFKYYLKGLVDKTGQAAYSKSLIIHPTTGETVTRDFADPAATTLAVQNANATQKTAMRTALLGTATPANPVLQDASSRFIQPGINVIDLIGLNLTLLDPTFLWIEKDDLTKIFATNFYNVSGSVVTSVWTIPADLPNGDYPIKIQNGVTVQGLSNAVFTKVDAITPLTISGTGWLRKVRKLDDGVTDSNDYNPGANQAVDDYMTISAVGIAGNNQPGIIAKTDNIILGSKDYDFEIKFQSIGSTGGSVGWNPFIGLTETTNANFTTVNDIVRNVVVNEVDLVSARINSGTSIVGLGGNPGQMWWVYFAKVRNKVYIRMYNKNTLSNFTYWSYDIDITKNYALFVANSSTTATHQPLRMLWINARIMN